MKNLMTFESFGSNHTMKIEAQAVNEALSALFESTGMESFIKLFEGEEDEIEDQAEEIVDELGPEGEEDADLKAALLMQAIESDGDLEQVDPEKVKETMESEGFTEGGSLEELNESGGGVIHVIEMIGNILGNSALVEQIAHKIEEKTGKKIDPSKMTKVVEKIKKVTGAPAKAIQKFFEWIGGKFGLSEAGSKNAGKVALAVMVLVLFAMGLAHFPVMGGGLLMKIISITGLIGKGGELLHLGKEIKDMIMKAFKGEKSEEGKGFEGDAADELKKMANAGA